MENVLNFLLCFLGAFVCICRVGKMHDAKMPMRVRYTLWAAMLAASSISPAWGLEVSWFQILFALCVLIDLGWVTAHGGTVNPAT